MFFSSFFQQSKSIKFQRCWKENAKNKGLFSTQTCCLKVMFLTYFFWIESWNRTLSVLQSTRPGILGSSHIHIHINIENNQNNDIILAAPFALPLGLIMMNQGGHSGNPHTHAHEESRVEYNSNGFSGCLIPIFCFAVCSRLALSKCFLVLGLSSAEQRELAFYNSQIPRVHCLVWSRGKSKLFVCLSSNNIWKYDIDRVHALGSRDGGT